MCKLFVIDSLFLSIFKRVFFFNLLKQNGKPTFGKSEIINIFLSFVRHRTEQKYNAALQLLQTSFVAQRNSDHDIPFSLAAADANPDEGIAPLLITHGASVDFANRPESVRYNSNPKMG